MKNAAVILFGIALNVQIALGRIDILTMFVLAVYEHGIFSGVFVCSSVSFISCR